MATLSQKSRREEPAARAVVDRIAPRRGTADRRLRVLERLTSGLSLADIARVENLTVRRVRQVIAEMLDAREVDPPAGFVPLQIARLGDAMVVAHTMMMGGDPQAMDRLIKLTGELDRYHGFAAPRLAPAKTASPRRAGPALRALSAPDAGGEKFYSPQSLENARNAEILGPHDSPEAGPRFHPAHPSKATRCGISGASAGGIG